MNSTPSSLTTRPNALALCLVVAGLLVCTTAQVARAQGYMGFNAGTSDFSRITSNNGNNGLYSDESRSTPYSLSIGNYFYDSHLGWELGYTHFGQVSTGGGSTKADGVNFSLIGRLPLTEQLNLLGKVGSTYGQTDISSQPLSGVMPGSANGFGWSYGVGAEMKINSWWSAVLQYDEHSMQFANVGWDRVSTTTLGARLRFR